MSMSDKQLMFIAQYIHEQLQRLHWIRFAEVQQRISTAVAGLDHLRHIYSICEICRTQEWELSASKLTQRILRVVRDIPHPLTQLERIAADNLQPLPSLRSIFEEVRQL